MSGYIRTTNTMDAEDDRMNRKEIVEAILEILHDADQDDLVELHNKIASKKIVRTGDDDFEYVDETDCGHEDTADDLGNGLARCHGCGEVY